MKVERLEHKLGIRASDTATIMFTDCRVPAENLLGAPEIDVKQGFAGAMQTFDNTRPLVAAMARRLRARVARPDARAARRRPASTIDYDRPAQLQRAAAAEFLQLEADWEAAHLLAAGGVDGRQRQAQLVEASMAKAKAGRVGNDITLRCVELCGTLGYSETELLEKWARDSKILDIFEGTQQIQQLIVARRILGSTAPSCAT